jgi:hypothetical protein
MWGDPLGNRMDNNSFVVVDLVVLPYSLSGIWVGIPIIDEVFFLKAVAEV